MLADDFKAEARTGFQVLCEPITDLRGSCVEVMVYSVYQATYNTSYCPGFTDRLNASTYRFLREHG